MRQEAGIRRPKETALEMIIIIITIIVIVRQETSIRRPKETALEIILIFYYHYNYFSFYFILCEA